jgi:hypothetical protein
MFGKHHNNGKSEALQAFDNYRPGFEYYFGFPSGDFDQFEPAMYRGISRVDADEGKERWLTSASSTISSAGAQEGLGAGQALLHLSRPRIDPRAASGPAEWIALQGQFDGLGQSAQPVCRQIASAWFRAAQSDPAPRKSRIARPRRKGRRTQHEVAAAACLSDPRSRVRR